MKLYVVRHGETDFNLHGRYAGSTDIPLNQQGFQQAAQLAEDLLKINFDLIVSSPMLRARQTAGIINFSRGLPIQIMDGFSERNMGVYEGLTRDEARQNHPKTWEKLSERGIDDAPEGGETIRQCNERVMAALEQLGRSAGEKTVLLVCHGFVSRLINRHFSGLDFFAMHSFSLRNCGIAEYET
ncbi:MAG: histidine phosphatase family protein [Christensenellales bacterium]|jgi:broad specificity phosphatase PhoE